MIQNSFKTTFSQVKNIASGWLSSTTCFAKWFCSKHVSSQINWTGIFNFNLKNDFWNFTSSFSIRWPFKNSILNGTHYKVLLIFTIRAILDNKHNGRLALLWSPLQIREGNLASALLQDLGDLPVVRFLPMPNLWKPSFKSFSVVLRKLPFESFLSENSLFFIQYMHNLFRKEEK